MNHAEDLRGRIVEYLDTRKSAAETARGIKGVWLERPSTPEHTAEVEHTLNDMASDGSLVKQILPRSVGLYYLPDDNEDE